MKSTSSRSPLSRPLLNTGRAVPHIQRSVSVELRTSKW